MAFLIDDAANYFCTYFLCALHKDVFLVVGHFHGVETYHLTDGINKGQILETGGHRKIFQLVIDEIDGLVSGSPVQVFKHFRQRQVLIVAANLLCVCA